MQTMKAITWIGLCGFVWLVAVAPVVAQDAGGRAGSRQAGPPGAWGGATAWLGVELGPVPDLLAAHLQLQIDPPAGETAVPFPPPTRGLLIVNLFRDSPADRAGLERYDVIVKADGEQVSGDVGVFTRHVGDKKPGDSLGLDLIRGGKPMSVTVVLEDRPRPWRELVLKYPEDPLIPRGGLRGKILRRGPDGRWELEDLGTLPWANGYGEDWAGRLRGEMSRRPADERAEINEAYHVDEQGRVVHVRRRPDGTITVKRYLRSEGQEQAEVNTYRDVHELRKTDPTAWKLLYPSDLRDEVQQYIEELREYAPRIRRWYERQEPFRDVPEKWREWEEHFFQGPLQRFRYFVRPSTPETAPAEEEELPAEVRFDVDAEGRVTVTVREPGTELNLTYTSLEEFQKQAPDLYARFARIREKIR